MALGSGTLASNLLRMRRTSTKISALKVQIKLPNISQSGSIDGGLPSRNDR